MWHSHEYERQRSSSFSGQTSAPSSVGNLTRSAQTSPLNTTLHNADSGIVADESHLIPSVRVYKEVNQFIDSQYPLTLTAKVINQILALIKVALDDEPCAQDPFEPQELPDNLQKYLNFDTLQIMCLTGLRETLNSYPARPANQESIAQRFAEFKEALADESHFTEFNKEKLKFFLETYTLLSKKILDLETQCKTLLETMFLTTQQEEFCAIQRKYQHAAPAPLPTFQYTSKVNLDEDAQYQQLHQQMLRNKIQTYNAKNMVRDYSDAISKYDVEAEELALSVLRNRNPQAFFNENIRPLLECVQDITDVLKIEYKVLNRYESFEQNKSGFETRKKMVHEHINELSSKITTKSNNLEALKRKNSFFDRWKIAREEKELEAYGEKLRNLKNIECKIVAQERQHDLDKINIQKTKDIIKGREGKLALYEEEKNHLFNIMQGIPEKLLSREEVINALLLLNAKLALRDQLLENLNQTIQQSAHFEESKQSLKAYEQELLKKDQSAQENEYYKVQREQEAAYQQAGITMPKNPTEVAVLSRRFDPEKINKLLLKKTQSLLIELYQQCYAYQDYLDSPRCPSMAVIKQLLEDACLIRSEQRIQQQPKKRLKKRVVTIDTIE